MLSEECFVLFKLESDQTHYWGKLDSKSETISVLVNSPFESNFKNIQQTSKSLKLKDVQILPPALPYIKAPPLALEFGTGEQTVFGSLD